MCVSSQQRTTWGQQRRKRYNQNMKGHDRMLYAQGDIILELVEAKPKAATKVGPANGRETGIDVDGSTVLARGEVTGHRHRFTKDSGVTLFRDDALARDMPSELYIGHVKVGAAGADLVHEEHNTISLPKGVYRIRRQREFTAESSRLVQD